MVFTISGTIGSGIDEIMDLLAEKTGYKVCDNKAFANIAVEAGYDSEAAAEKYYDFDSIEGLKVSDIRKISSAQKKNRNAIGILTHDVIPMDIRMEESMRGIINSLADEGNYIILGHCANYYLKDRTDCIRIFITRDIEQRAANVSEDFEVSYDAAFKIIKKNDKRRSDFYSYFTSQKWQDSDNYDIFINTDRVSTEKISVMLMNLAE